MPTLKFLFPEWQGYAEDQRVAEGVTTLCSAWDTCDHFANVPVPETEPLPTESAIIGHDAINRNTAKAMALLRREQPARTLMLGGTCGAELAPVAWLNAQYKGDLAVLWFDAHADLNTPASSPSGHFHGMILRTLLGEGADTLVALVPRRLRPEQVTLLGTRSIDPGEAAWLARTEAQCLPPDKLTPEAAVEAAGRAGATRLYIHLDLDFFNPADFPNVLMPTPGGWGVEQLTPVLHELTAAFDVVGLSVVEYVGADPAPARRIHAMLAASGVLAPFDAG